MPSAPSNDEKLEGVLVNPATSGEARTASPDRGRAEEDIEVVFDKQVNEKFKGKTLVQLKEAKASADLVSNNIGECIQEIEEKVIFEEPLDQQFKRIFGFKIPNCSMTKELFQKVIIPVLKRMSKDDQQFFYEHYRGILPKEWSIKYYY